MQRGRGLFVATMLAPAGLLYSTFVLYPMVRAFLLSLYQWSGLSGQRTFIGLANFGALASEQPPEMLTYLGHNAVFFAVSAAVVLPLAMFFAVTLAGRTPGAGFYRAAYLFPNVISVVAVGSLWYFIYDGDYGLLNAGLRALGFAGNSAGWLGDSSTALGAIIATSIWASLGFYILLFNAGVQSIPPSFHEAAAIDGASGWTAFWNVTLPLTWEVVKLGVLYLVIHCINVFGLVYVMNMNQPNSDTDVLLTYLYQKGFAESDFGYASAIASVGFVLILAAVLLSLRLLRRETVEV